MQVFFYKKKVLKLEVFQDYRSALFIIIIKKLLP